MNASRKKKPRARPPRTLVQKTRALSRAFHRAMHERSGNLAASFLLECLAQSLEKSDIESFAQAIHNAGNVMAWWPNAPGTYSTPDPPPPRDPKVIDFATERRRRRS